MGNHDQVYDQARLLTWKSRFTNTCTNQSIDCFNPYGWGGITRAIFKAEICGVSRLPSRASNPISIECWRFQILNSGSIELAFDTSHLLGCPDNLFQVDPADFPTFHPLDPLHISQASYSGMYPQSLIFMAYRKCSLRILSNIFFCFGEFTKFCKLRGSFWQS